MHSDVQEFYRSKVVADNSITLQLPPGPPASSSHEPPAAIEVDAWFREWWLCGRDFTMGRIGSKHPVCLRLICFRSNALPARCMPQLSRIGIGTIPTLSRCAACIATMPVRHFWRSWSRALPCCAKARTGPIVGAFGRPCLQPCSKAIDGSMAWLEMPRETLYRFQQCSLCIARKSCAIGSRLILHRLSPATHGWAIGTRRPFSGSRRWRCWCRKAHCCRC